MPANPEQCYHRTITKFLLIALCVLIPTLSSAHPHVFMDTRISFQFKEQKLEGFWVEWLFDEIFSASIKMDFDADRDNQFSPEEVYEIEKGAFANLKNFDYFTYITQGDKKTAVQTVESFSAKMKTGRLHYRFFVPYPVNVGKSLQTLRIAVYDENFYCDIAFQKKTAVKLKGTEKVKVSYRIQLDEEKVINYDNSYQTAAREGAFYDGIANPYEILLNFRRNH